MLLEDATSEEQVAAALEAGDDELRRDIEKKLEEAKDEWEQSGRGYDDDPEPIDMRSVVTQDDFIDRVILTSPAAYELSDIPREKVEEALRYAASHPSRGRTTHYGPFYIDHRGGAHFSYTVEQGGSYSFRGSFFPENAKLIPSEMAMEFWDGLGPEYSWDQRSRVDSDDDFFGTGPGTEMFIEAPEGDFDEWCRDLVSEYVREAVKSEPEKAKSVFFAALANEDKALAEKLKAAKLDDEELLEFVTSWFEGDNEQAEIVETIRDYFAALESPTSLERETVITLSKQDIADMGIRQGTLFENAPWKLIKLHPADLRMEGTLMGHCVGKAGMGYVRAVKDGEIEIWSLRSRDNKPRFTLEIDKSKWDSADGPRVSGADIVRARSILQLKGKANRTPGYADVRKTGGVKFPDEVIIWTHVLNALGVDPTEVDDFDAPAGQVLDEYRERGAFGQPPLVQRNDGEQCVGFDMPYRSPDVRQNRRRRSSRRRTSRRRSSKIRA